MLALQPQSNHEQLPPGVHPLSSLETFPRFTRASYAAKHGKSAPSFDPSRPIQRWFDPAVAALLADPKALQERKEAGEDVYQYRTYVPDSSGAPVWRLVNIPLEHAGAPNLPGVQNYPPLVVTRVEAWQTAPDGTRQLVNPDGFVTIKTARALQSEIRGYQISVGEIELSLDVGPFAVEYAPSELRRAWVMRVNGQTQNAGLLWRARCAGGVGAPGDWSLIGGAPVFTVKPAPTGLFDARPEALAPMRRAAGDERVRPGFGGVLQVEVPAPLTSDADLMPRRVKQIMENTVLILEEARRG